MGVPVHQPGHANADTVFPIADAVFPIFLFTLK